jgi:hypothetical protein
VHWYRTLDWILSAIERFPRNARFSLASRIGDTALDVMEDIVRAIYSRDRAEILDRLNLQLELLRVLFRIAHDRRYLSSAQWEYIARELNAAGRMVGGWKKSLNKGERR